MTSIGTLWGDDWQPQTRVILSVAALNGLKLEFPPFSLRNRPDEFTSKFLYGKIPTFESKDGFQVVEGAPIARYLSKIGNKVNLVGSNAQEAAIINQWVHFAESEIHIPNHGVKDTLDGNYIYSRPMLDNYHSQVIRALTYLESYLSTRPSGYVALDTLTLADLFVAGASFFASRFSLGSAERAQYPHIFAHYTRVTEDERYKQYWGTKLFADVRPVEPLYK